VKYRKLRIAWSAFCLLGCELLIVYWVSSYERPGGAILRISQSDGEALISVHGEVGLAHSSQPWRIESLIERGFVGIQVDELNRSLYPDLTERPLPARARLRWTRTPVSVYVGAPYWLLTAAAAALTVVPWIRPSKRFSLRALLIVTTLIAVGLGLAVYAARS
jgi:hypothetical protein